MIYGNNTLDFLSILHFYCNFGRQNIVTAVLIKVPKPFHEACGLGCSNISVTETRIVKTS